MLLHAPNVSQRQALKLWSCMLPTLLHDKLWNYVVVCSQRFLTTSFETMLLYAPNVSRRRNHSLTHILCFLDFLNGNWHKITAWQIQTANSNNRVSSSKFIMTFCCCQSTVLLKRRVFSRLISLLLLLSLLHFRESYYNSIINVCNLKIFLQFEL